MSHAFDRYMPFFGADFYESENVLCMSLAGQAVYLRALWYQWKHGSLPTELERLARVLGIGLDEMQRLWPEIQPCFEVVDGRLANARCAVERERILATAQAASKAGKASAAKRSSNAEPTPVQRPLNARSTPVQPEEERRGEERREIEEPPLPPTGDAPAEEAKPAKRRKAETWQAVLEQPEFATLKADPAFALAWQDWVKHCRTAGSKAKEPQGIRAAKIFREAMREGSARYARAIEQAIIHNWQGIWVRDDARPAQQAAAQPRNASQRNLDILQSSFEKLGIIGTQERLL